MDCRYKNVEKENSYEDTPSIEAIKSSKEGGYLYLVPLAIIHNMIYGLLTHVRHVV